MVMIAPGNGPISELPADAGEPAIPAAARSLRQRIIKAAGWSMTAYVSGYGLRLVSSLIMTRLLVPDMFGVMAVATIVQIVASMLCDVGLRQSVIQNKRGDDPAFLDTAWTMQVIRGIAIWLACVACAGTVAWAAGAGWFAADSVYAVAELPPIIAAMAFSSVILGFQSTKSMSSDRHFNQKQLAMVELGVNVIALTAAVVAGYLTRSIWSFVFSNLVAALAAVALTHLCLPGHRNRLRLERESFFELVHFGRWILVSSLFSVLAANGDRILLAGWTNPATLGLYVLAFNLIVMIEGGGGRLVWSVAMPVFSRIAHDRPEEIRAVYYRCRLPLDLILVGSAGFLYGAGEAIIRVLYDHRYAGAGEILQILSFGLLLTRFSMASALFLAIGKPRNLGIINGVKTLALFLTVPLANMLFGFEAALWAIALHGLATLPVIFAMKRAHKLGNPAFEAAALLFWPAGYAVGLLATHLAEPFRALL